MILYFSGGSAIVETSQKNPAIMLSYFVNVNLANNKPDSRLRKAIAIRSAKKCKSKPSKKKKGP
jgi:hypothetical protein